MISIELISRGEKSLEDVLKSIKRQDYQDYEIICADSSGKRDVDNLLQSYGCKIVRLPAHTPFLRARYEAHINSVGVLSLLLDSTRPIKPNALSFLISEYKMYDMTIIREDSVGKGFWVKQAKLLRDISEEQFSRTRNESTAFLLPRLYNYRILSNAFENIKVNAGQLFDKIGYGEHQIIFDECKRYSLNIGITKEALISHYEDDSFRKIISKYYRYGKSQKTLNGMRDIPAKRLSTHIRRDIGIRKRIITMPVVLARGMPFVFGYLFGRSANSQ